MGNLIIKGKGGAGNKLIIQDQAGNAVLTTGDSVGAAIPIITGDVTVTGDLVPSTALSHRNMIINGAMQISQRGTSSTGVTSGGYQNAPDRFTTGIASIGTYTISQSTDAPAGFGKSYKIDCTTADASPAASDNFTFETRLEGYDLQSWKKGTSSALPVTLSFWVKSNKTGNGQVNLRDLDNTRQCGNTYTISSANTWEYKTITFPADTTGAFGDDNGNSLRIEWWIDSGSNFKSGTTPTAWVSNADNQHRNVGGTLNLADSTANEWFITGVQLELGSNATPFEHRSYGEELVKCQRYLISSFADGVTPGGTAPASLKHHYVSVYPYSSGNFAGIITEFPVRLRSGAPTITFWTGNASTSATSGRVAYFDGGWGNNNGLTVDTGQSGHENFNLGGTINSGTRLIQFNYLADAEL